MTDLIFSRKSKTDTSIKGKTKGHVLLVIDLFCLMFYFGFVFDYDCLKGGNSKSLSNHNDEGSENNFLIADAIKKRSKKGGNIRRLVVTDSIVRHIQQKESLHRERKSNVPKGSTFGVCRCRRRSSYEGPAAPLYCSTSTCTTFQTNFVCQI